MKTLHIFFFLFLLLISGTSNGQTAFTMKETSFDFGNVYQWDKAEKEFEIFNTGKRPITISHMTTSGGGAQGDWPKEPINPGRKGYLKIMYHTGNLGPFNRMLTAYINDSAVPITIRGRVIEKPTIVEVSNKNIDVGRVNYGENYTASFTITNSGKRDLNFRFLESQYHDIDFLGLKIDVDTNMIQSKHGYFGLRYKPGATLNIIANFINNYGNVGGVTRRLKILVNDADTLTFEIKAYYRSGDIPTKVTTTNDRNTYIYSYNKNAIKTMEAISNTGIDIAEYIFKDGDIVSKKDFRRKDKKKYNETFYKKGKVIAFKPMIE